MANEHGNGVSTLNTQAAVHEGLRGFLISTFNTMALGVAFTALVAWYVGGEYAAVVSGQGSPIQGLIEALYGSPLRWALIFAPLGLSFLFGGAIWTARPAVAHAMFWTFAAVFALAVVPLIGTLMVTAVNTIFLAFLMASVGFLSLSIYGYTTKADLTSWGSFGRIAILVAIFSSLAMWGLTAFGIMDGASLTLMHKVINVVVALASLALTAFSIQMLKGAYFSIVSGEWADQDRSVEQQLQSAGVAGALALYINFMNLFMSLLSLLRGGD